MSKQNRPGVSMEVAPTRVAILGLGRMGRPISALLGTHFIVVGFDPDCSRARRANAGGIEIATSAEDAVAGADIVVAVLPGADVEREVFLGPTKLVEKLQSGQLLIEFTSGDPRLADELDAATRARDVSFVSAPMGGGPAQAASASLTFFVGGRAEAVERAMGVLAHLARSHDVHVLGDTPRHAQSVKLLINALWFGQAELATEVLLLGANLGVPPSTLLPILADSAAGGRVLSDAMPHVLKGDYLETFGLRRVVEELGAVSAIAAAVGSPIRLLDSVVAAHRDALMKLGPVDGELRIVEALEDEAGFSLRDAG